MSATAHPAVRNIALSTAAVVACFTVAVLVQNVGAPLATGILVGAMAAIVMLHRPELATVLGVFLIYVNFPAILTKQLGVPHVVAGSFILILGFPILYAIFIRREALRADSTFVLKLLLLVVYLLSAVTMAIDRSVAVAAVREYMLEGLLLYWLAFNVMRRAATIRRVIWTILLAGAFLSSLSLYQTATGRFDQEFGGLAYRNYEVIQDAEERDGPARRKRWDRAQGPLNEPNRFAQVLLVLLPFAVYLGRHARARSARMTSTIAGLLVLAGVLLTLSRGAFLALFAMTVMMLAVRWIRLAHVLAVLLVLALSIPAVPFLALRMSTIARAVGVGGNDAAVEAGLVDTAALGRLTLMRAAWRVFIDHPVLGVGPGQFPPFYSQAYSSDPEIRLRDMPAGAWRAHSFFLEIAAESGVLGVGLFAAMVVVLLRRLAAARRRWVRSDMKRADLATTLIFSISAYHLAGIFLHLSYQPYYWFLLALGGAALHATWGDPMSPPDSCPRGTLDTRRAAVLAGARAPHA